MEVDRIAQDIRSHLPCPFGFQEPEGALIIKNDKTSINRGETFQQGTVFDYLKPVEFNIRVPIIARLLPF